MNKFTQTNPNMEIAPNDSWCLGKTSIMEMEMHWTIYSAKYTSNWNLSVEMVLETPF